MPKTITTVSDLRVDLFMADLTELSRRHRIGVSGEVILFEMEPEDMPMQYEADAESVVRLK